MKTEHEEQREFVQWFRRAFPEVRIFAIPNGGGRSRSQGAKLKMEGVSPGVPDLFIPEWLLWVEMKREKGGRVSPEQKDWINYLDGLGHNTMVGNGFDEAQIKVLTFHKNIG
jgi:hypothetical protein